MEGVSETEYYKHACWLINKSRFSNTLCTHCATECACIETAYKACITRREMQVRKMYHIQHMIQEHRQHIAYIQQHRIIKMDRKFDFEIRKDLLYDLIWMEVYTGDTNSKLAVRDCACVDKVPTGTVCVSCSKARYIKSLTATQIETFKQKQRDLLLQRRRNKNEEVLLDITQRQNVIQCLGLELKFINSWFPDVEEYPVNTTAARAHLSI